MRYLVLAFDIALHLLIAVGLIVVIVLLLSSCTTDCQGSRLGNDIVCPLYIDPVCGCNGEMYTNVCFAKMDGVRKWSYGDCEK